MTREMIKEFPEQIYLHTMVGKCLNEIYQRQKDHTLGQIVDLPGPDNNEEYNMLLNLIQNIRLNELAALSYYYMQQHTEKFKNDKGFSEVWEKSYQNFTR